MANVKVAAAIAEAQAARSRRTEVTADRVVLELARVAFGDPRRVMSWGPGGVKLRPSAELADEEAAIVAEVGETTTKEGGTIRLKMGDKLGALRLLAQHLGMLGEGKVAVTVATGAGELAGLQAVLLGVLDRHPDAKRAVVAALEAVAADASPAMRDAARALLHALDPVAFARDRLGFEADEWQARAAAVERPVGAGLLLAPGGQEHHGRRCWRCTPPCTGPARWCCSWRRPCARRASCSASSPRCAAGSTRRRR